MTGRMGPGILSGSVEGFGERRRPRKVAVKVGMMATHRGSGFTGAVTSFGPSSIVLRAPSSGVQRHFPLRTADFLVAGEVVTLATDNVPSAPPLPAARTASGSLAASRSKARVARASRLLVEGVHDAELVEKVWGDDLRDIAVVVERLDGLDRLAEVLARFRPAADARLGVLVDHLVPGSKESRLVASLSSPFVQVKGTPFVDVWQAVRPSVVGLMAWPAVPPGRPWKEGVCEALGERSPGHFWRKLLGHVKTYADLEPALVGAVEALIDFVTAPGDGVADSPIPN